MKVVRLADANGKPALIPDQAPLPRPGRDELLVRVCAAGVILTELTWQPTWRHKDGTARARAVPAHEFSGVVAAGEGAGEIGTGREVFGMNDWYADGALAEYCVAPSSAVAPKPRSLSHAAAASVPISALTAWQGLFGRAQLKAGERVLVHGGAGSVGGYAVQLARLKGAHVVATASARNREFVAGLGAEQVIDYRESRFEDHAGGMDVVFDTVGGETLERSWSVLQPGGRLVTIVSSEADSTDERVRQAFFIVEPNGQQLAEIAGMLEAGKLRAVVDRVIPLSEAPKAYRGELPRQGRGKLVVAVDDGR